MTQPNTGRAMLGPAWRKSSASGTSNCVEVLVEPAAVRLRNSKNPAVETAFTYPEWAAFLTGVRSGEFDL